MKLRFIDESRLKSFILSHYKNAAPFPHHSFESLLTQKAFESLSKDYPPLEWFEKSVGNYRGSQRPHDRYLLSLDRSVYHNPGYQGKGLVARKKLPESWQTFLNEIESSTYRNFIAAILKKKFVFHYEWHLGFKTSEVSPHKDARFRLGNQLFYFNDLENWNDSWGGNLLLLGGKIRGSHPTAPEFRDFNQKISIPTIGNRSVLFHNSARSWHGVEPLKCPAGNYRRLFAVMFIRPDSAQLFPTPIQKFKRFLLKFKNSL